MLASNNALSLRECAQWSIIAAVALLSAVVHGIGNFTLPVMSNLLYLAVAISAGLGGPDGTPLPAAPRGPETERIR